MWLDKVFVTTQGKWSRSLLIIYFSREICTSLLLREFETHDSTGVWFHAAKSIFLCMNKHLWLDSVLSVHQQHTSCAFFWIEFLWIRQAWFYRIRVFDLTSIWHLSSLTWGPCWICATTAIQIFCSLQWTSSFQMLQSWRLTVQSMNFRIRYWCNSDVTKNK